MHEPHDRTHGFGSVHTNDQLVVFVTSVRDAHTLAAFLEAGAAALESAPGHGVTDASFRRRDVEVGRSAGEALRAEANRIHERNEDRHRSPARARTQHPML